MNEQSRGFLLCHVTAHGLSVADAARALRGRTVDTTGATDAQGLPGAVTFEAVTEVGDIEIRDLWLRPGE